MDFLFANYTKNKYYIHITKILHLYYKLIKGIDVLTKNDKIKRNIILLIVKKRSIIDKK